MPRNNTLIFPSRDEMLTRAVDMVSNLRERAIETEDGRQIPDFTINELHDNGLLRVTQPKRVGGGDFDYRLMLEITMTLGQGCGSTAWVYVNLACHHWMLGMWPVEGQDFIWGEDKDALIASSVIYPAGKAQEVDGGYRLSGRWPFCSGVDCAGWIMLGGRVENSAQETSGNRVFLVRKPNIDVIDTWQASGLCGTGSKDVAADALFVPDYMTIAAEDMQNCNTPGSAVNPNPIFNLPQAGLFPHIIAAPIIGMAEGACDDFTTANKVARSTYNTSRVADYQAVQIKVASAAAAVRSAKLSIFADCNEATATLESGESCTEEQKHRWRRDAAYAANLCYDAVEGLYKATGGRGAYKTNPIQRHYRDISVGISHISMSWDVIGAEWGRYALGIGPNPTL
ncbi:MAG: acyl-CoA dehydrogenase [Rhodospirillaceae bacterium]|nr:acyl-CoA dehydrogenase [Rhodospirillaceae bacterium]